MPTTNEQLTRADIAINQLDTNGGLLPEDQSNAFIDMLFDEPTILQQVRKVRMNAPEVKLNKIGFGTRILHGASWAGSANDDGSNDRYLLKSKRSAPRTSQIKMNSSEAIAEIRIPYEVLEDNIEGEALETHILRLIAKQAASDLEELALWGDTSIDAGVDDFLCLQDGYLKRANAHIADNAGEGVSPDLFANALLAFPQKYLRNINQMKAFVAPAQTIKYRQRVSQRQTGFGDTAIYSTAFPLNAHGLNIEQAPMLSLDGVGSTGLVTYPQNLIWGIRRDITIETDKDIRSREYVIVVTMRVGTGVEDVDAIVKLTNI